MSLILIRKQKPLTPAQRWKTTPFSFKTKNKPSNSLVIKKKWNAGRVQNGRIGLYSKKSKVYKTKIYVTATRVRLKEIIVVTNKLLSIEHRKPFVRCLTNKKSMFLLPATTTNNPGTIFYADTTKKRAHERAFIGIPVLITLFPYYFTFCNIADESMQKYKYTTASGSSSFKMRAQKKEKLIKTKLTSGILKFFKKSTVAIGGKTKQMWKHKKILGSAGTNARIGRKPSVRGIAMNSVDHPNGGKANSAQPEKSPWGWIAKKNK